MDIDDFDVDEIFKDDFNTSNNNIDNNELKEDENQEVNNYKNYKQRNINNSISDNKNSITNKINIQKNEIKCNNNNANRSAYNNTIKNDDNSNKVKDSSLIYYYNHLFPYNSYFKWYGNSDSSYFERREFSFTKKGEIYIRFISFKDDHELKQEINKALPIKIDVGAVYNTLPKYRASSSMFYPVEKELVFDIDMTDYDDVRTCCKETNICNKCWKYIEIAYIILDTALRDDFGFKKILWVFSGRRGIHCWIKDDSARKLTNEGRSAIANYLSWKTINKTTGLNSTLKDNIHPAYLRAHKIISDKFEEYVLKNQDILNDFNNNNNFNDIILIITKSYMNHLRELSEHLNNVQTILNNKTKSSVDKWNEYVEYINKIEKNIQENNKKDKQDFKNNFVYKIIIDIQMAIMYPKLDINVSKHINHLLKSPFCIHPKTGMVSVPLDKHNIVNFDINNIPTIDEAVEDHKNKRQGKFNNFIEIFNKQIII